MSATREKEEKSRAAHVPRVATAAFLVTMGAHATMAAAQPGTSTWRCGNTYSDRPCEGGRTVKVDDSRSDADRRAADEATRRNGERADALERTRLSQERQAHEHDRRAAQEARRAEMDERRLAASEQQARARAGRLAAEPRKATASFSDRPGTKRSSNEAPAAGAEKKRKRSRSSDSDAG